MEGAILAEQPETEKQHLKVGYRALIADRYPVNTDFRNCYNHRSAYFSSIETKHLAILPALEFESLKEAIPEKHRDRIGKIWEKVLEHKTKMQKQVNSFKKLWDLPNDEGFRIDLASENFVNSSPIVIREEFRRATMAAISKDPSIEHWQTLEKDVRTGVYAEFKTFRVALRLYYEMLLERSPQPKDPNEQYTPEYVLPKDHPLRKEIVIRNRYLRVIDATHSCINAAKAAHHQQTKGRLRKGEKKPYIFHASDVTLAIFRDVLPFIIEEPQLPINPVIFAIVGPIHDILEDTDLTLADLLEYIKPLIDKYDSSLDPVIKSGFGKERDEIKRTVLDLMEENIIELIETIMRVLSNNTDLKSLSGSKKKHTLKVNLIGAQKTCEELGITPEDLTNWGIDMSQLSKPANAFQKFPEEYDKRKLSRFFVRSSALAESPKKRQIISIIKMADRAHNVETLHGFPVDKQKAMLRATTSRLIAYAILDHDNTNFPFYNVLPRLIDNTIKAYQDLANQHAGSMEQTDFDLLGKLYQWKTECIRMVVPQETQAVIEEFNGSRKEQPPTPSL